MRRRVLVLPLLLVSVFAGCSSEAAPTETYYSEGLPGCPKISIDLPASYEAKPASDGASFYYVDAETSWEVSIIAQASAELVASPAFHAVGAIDIAGRDATHYATEADDTYGTTNIVFWDESDTCGFYAFVATGPDETEAAALAGSLRVD